MNLVVDIGNTQTKLAVFNSGEMVRTGTVSGDAADACRRVLKEFDVKNALLASTGETGEDIPALLEAQTDRFIRLGHETPLPFENLYESPETLGADRLGAAAGATAAFPGRNVLVIDLGSAITIDVITGDNRFIGGNISPGMAMRFRALHEFTARLPLGGPEEAGDFPGKTTRRAIASGVVSGIVFELEGYINRLSSRYDEVKIVATGGEAPFFVKKLKNHIFVDPNLIMKGLNRILDHNEQSR